MTGVMKRDTVRCGRELCEANASSLCTAVLEEGDVVSTELVSPYVLFACQVL